MVHLTTAEEVDLKCSEAGCGGKKFMKRICIEQLPALVTFFLERYEWNLRTGNRDKVSDKFAFPLVIDMAPYLEENIDKPQVPLPTPPVTAKPTAATPLPAANPPSATAAPAAAANTATPSTTNKPMTKEEKAAAKKKAKEEAAEDEAWPPLEQPAFDEKSNHLCDLFAVVIHSGSAHGGHYHAFIRDPTSFVAAKEGTAATTTSNDGKDANSKPVWFDFNDSRVTAISTEQLAQQYGGAKKGENACMYTICTVYYLICHWCVPHVP
jgi:hypothetical protein